MSRHPRTLAALGLAAILATGAPATAQNIPEPLVPAAWLHENAGASTTRIIDIRDPAAFAEGHIPAAINGVYPGIVRSPDWRILDVEELALRFSALGISNETGAVVVPAGTDSTEFGGASSVYWALQYLGHADAAILDGGMTAWQGDGTRPLDTGAGGGPTAESFRPDPRPEIRATTEDVTAALDDGRTLIIDARPPEQYRGESKSGLVARAGRIPGAVNLPHTDIFDAASHRLKPAGQIRALLVPDVASGDRPIIVYCNTGHWSSIVWFALHEVLGLDNVRLYDGSMKAWTEDPDRPVEAGSP